MREFIDIVEGAQTPTIPTRSFRVLYHVGTLNVADKRGDSHEGAGLSVSLHPDEWRRIASGRVSGATWRCTKPGNRFINAHRLPKAARSKIADWAIQNGFAARETTYRIARYDDELEQEHYLPFLTRAEAEREADDGDEIEEVPGSLVGTPALATRTHAASLALAEDLILTVYAEEHGFDGVWWQDVLDVTAYSAPRGVIVPRMVGTWSFERA